MSSAFYRRLRAALEAEQQPLTPDRVCQLLAEQFGGDRVHIGKRWQEPEVLPTDTPQTVQRRYKIGRSTAHRWTTRWKS